MSRISESFASLHRQGRGGLIPFVTAGDPDLEMSYELLLELARAGAAIVELGVPFSDPMADGPVIQRASQRALASRKEGVGVADILDLVKQARLKTEVPIVLFSYFNPLLQYDLARLAREAKSAGVDAILVTDLVPEEAAEFSAMLRRSGLDMIFLVAPTSTDDRLRLVAKRASGFIYAVSRTGVTGAQAEVSNEAAALVARVRTVSDLPVAVGFGISTANQVAEVWQYADAAVVGSALVAEIESKAGSPDLVKRIGRFARDLMPSNYESARKLKL